MINPNVIAYTAAALHREGSPLDQAFGCAIAEALGYDPYDIEACNLAGIAEDVIRDQGTDQINAPLIVVQTIARCASLKLDKRLPDAATVIDLGIAPSHDQGGCLMLLIKIIGGGLLSCARYPSARGNSRRFTAGVVQATIKATKERIRS